MHLYVGNLAPTVTEGDLRLIFEGAGEVVCAQLDPAAGRPAGYAYVAVADATQAQIAVAALHGRYLKGAALVVEAVAERARVGARQQSVSRALPVTVMASRRNRAAALGLYLVKNDT
jgi:RNA recognition motif-containing protein